MVVVCFIYIKYYQFVEYPVGFLISILSVEFGTKIGFPIVLRQLAIIIFFCRMHCFLFKSVDKDFRQLSKNYRKNRLKTCLSFHYKLCDSVEELQTFLRPMFVSITSLWCPIYCYILYFYMNNKNFENNLIAILTSLVAFIFFLINFYLSLTIAMIDIEAKKGLHYVYGCALKLLDKQAHFPVSITYIKII